MPLNLTTLPLDEASTLEAIAQAAIIQLGNQADAAMSVVRANGPGHWQEQHKAEHARARRLMESARRLQAAALRRAHDAEREQCVAVRMIEALAHRLGGYAPALKVAA